MSRSEARASAAFSSPDQRAMRFMGDGATLPRAEVERWIGVCQQRYADPGYGTSAVFEKNGGAFVGFCGVVRAAGNDFSEIIYAYRVESWGRGYATEAGRAMIEYVFGRSALVVIPSDRAVPAARDHGRLVPMRGRVGRAIERLARLVLEDDA